MNLPEASLLLRGEAFVMAIIKILIYGGRERELYDDFPIPFEGCSYEFEYPVRRGRADIVMFHIDGTATVVEVKDGSNGIQSVLAGIGQVTGYAVQIGMSNGAPKHVRKALIFTSTGSKEGDENVLYSCAHAGVIPIFLGDYKSLREAQEQFVERMKNASPE